MQTQYSAAAELFAGRGETAELLRDFAWETTPLGPVENWPQSLKTAIRIMITSRQPIWIGWGEELIYFYNDAYKSIIGGKHPWALGKPTREVWSEIWLEIAPMLATAMSGTEGTYVEEQLLIMERNGYPEETYYTFSYSPIPDDNNSPGGIICANTDDTQRVISERQLALLSHLAGRISETKSWLTACEHSMAGLGANLLDLPFAALYIKDGDSDSLILTGVSGFDRAHPAVPATLTANLSPWPFENTLCNHQVQVVEGLIAIFDEALPAGAWKEPPHKAAILPILPTGESGRSGVLIVGLNPFRLFDDNYQSFLGLVAGQISAAIANALAYEEERKRAEALAEIDKAKTIFFSNVSHEFRTPLTLMLGPLQQVLDNPELQNDIRVDLDVAHRNGLRLLKLVNSLLDFSRVEAGRMQATFTPENLAAFTADLASNFRSACEQAGLALTIDCATLPEPVYIDRDMWEKIVFNLLSNAFKFTFHGGIRISLRATAGSVLLEVKDTGVGIPEVELPHIFERFHRVESSRGRSHEGTGIGLALVKELVKLHGGSINVTSAYGEGTCFIVEIPFGVDHLPVEQIGKEKTLTSTATRADAFVAEALRWLPHHVERNPPEDGRFATPRARILLADDNADMRDYIQRILQDSYDVFAVEDGQAALEYAQKQRPDLILSDVMMPRLDGFGLLARLRQTKATKDVPFILLSARAGEEAEIEGIDAGADDYLVKPFNARELKVRVRALLAKDEARREQENYFHMLADNSPAILWTTDADGMCTYLSRQWYEFTGGNPGEDLGLGWLDKIHPEDFPSTKVTFMDANHKQIPFRSEYRLRASNGDYRWAIDAGMPRFDNGRFIGFVGCVFDIAERREAEQKLRASEMALREADKRKDEFLATLAHELRNPLAPISNALQIMRLTHDSSTVAEMRELIDRQLAQMVRLVDDLMDVSRITRGKVELRKERLSLVRVIQNTIEVVQPLAAEREQRLHVRIPQRDIWLEADFTRLSQVFTNIVNNACKYTQPGGTIEVTVTESEHEVAVTVQDNGIGIPPDKLPFIFEMFTQVEDSLGRTHGGLGIGLTLAEQLVKMHGGSLEAFSEGLGKGSRFTVILPKVPTMVTEAQPGQELSGRSPEALRILVVDDNRESAKTLGQLVELLGHSAHVVFDGASAIALAQELVPDLVLLDIGMPEMNGYEACQQMKTIPALASTVFVAQTGWGEKRHSLLSQEAGFDRHLVKPIDLAVLQDLLADVIAQVR